MAAPAPDAARSSYRDCLGDPAALKFKFPDKGAGWFIAPDVDGAVWVVLRKGAGGESYNGAQLVQRNFAGCAPLLPAFYATEGALQNATGAQTASNLHAVRQNNGTVRVVEFLFPVDGDKRPLTIEAPAEVLINAATNRADRGPLVAGSPLAERIGRVSLRFSLPLPSGKKFEFIAVGNPRFRIAIITGFPGPVEGGDTWIQEAVRTLVDIVVAVVGVYTGNVGLVVAAVQDTISTWYGFAQELSAIGATGDANKLTLDGMGGGIGGGGSVPPGDKLIPARRVVHPPPVGGSGTDPVRAPVAPPAASGDGGGGGLLYLALLYFAL